MVGSGLLGQKDPIKSQVKNFTSAYDKVYRTTNSKRVDVLRISKRIVPVVGHFHRPRDGYNHMIADVLLDFYDSF